MDSAFWVGTCTEGSVGVAWHAGKGANQCLRWGGDLSMSCLFFCGGEQQLQQEAVKVSNTEEFHFLGDPVLVWQQQTGQRESQGGKAVKPLQQVSR